MESTAYLHTISITVTIHNPLAVTSDIRALINVQTSHPLKICWFQLHDICLYQKADENNKVKEIHKNI